MTKRQIDFINLVAPIAVRQAKKHDHLLFPSVTVAQAAHESGWGTSTKMVKANALYGIKVGKSAYKFGTAWTGAAYKTGTTEYYDGKNPTKIVDYFRAYDSIEAATEDYMDMLCHAARYKKALGRKTPLESITAIVTGGYATGPDYVAHIMATINNANLTIYDRQGFSDPVEQPGDSSLDVQVLPVLKKGSEGEYVRNWQIFLNLNGYSCGFADGIFGPKTDVAVRKWQKDHGLTPDGVIGPKTWASLPMLK